MHGNWNTLTIGIRQNAARGIPRLGVSAGEKFADGFAVTDAGTRRVSGNLIELLAGFTCHAKFAGADAGIDILRSVPGDGNLKIVDQGRAIHGDSGDKTSLHQIDQNGAQADFDDVAADAPQNRFFAGARAMHRSQQLPQIFRRQKMWKRVQKFRQRDFAAAGFAKPATLTLLLREASG